MLRTRVGTLNLLAPQDREGTFSTRLFSRVLYQRNEKALCFALMEVYVEGVSTRKVQQITEELCGTSFSKSLVSSEPGDKTRSFPHGESDHSKPKPTLAAAYPYLFVDARYEKVRMDRRIVRDDGMREILAVEIADTESDAESEVTYQELFRSLKGRGLSGVELVVSDDHGDLKAAIARHFQGASHQRCQVHYSRNLFEMVGHAKRKDLSEGLRGVFAATSREMALRLASELAARWHGTHPRVACHLEEHIEECLPA